MKIAISAESTIDLPKDILEEYDIKTLPFSVILGDNEYLDGEITSRDIFDYVAKNKILPKTSAINESQYEEHFRRLLGDYDAIIHISLSSEISSAFSNARRVAERFENIYVVDSQSLSTGIALLALYARSLADKGEEVEKIYDKTRARVGSVQASFVIERLDYLYKGGRCGALAYFGANLLNLRPQIIVKDGKMGAYRKYRGNMEKVVSSYCKDTLNEFSNPDLTVAFVTYTTATEGMEKIAKEALIERGFKKVYVTHAGGTIASHCGEHTLGILYINDGDAHE